MHDKLSGLPKRTIHLDFHTSSAVPDAKADFIPKLLRRPSPMPTSTASPSLPSVATDLLTHSS